MCALPTLQLTPYVTVVGSLCQADPGWSYYNGSCYYGNDGIGDQGLSWRLARQYCQKHGGDLASILSFSEQLFIHRTLVS